MATEPVTDFRDALKGTLPSLPDGIPDKIVGSNSTLLEISEIVSLTAASQAEAEAGVLNDKGMTSLRTRQAQLSFAMLRGFGNLNYGDITDPTLIAENTATIQAAFNSGYGRIYVPAETIVTDLLIVPTGRFVSLQAFCGGR